MSGQKTNSGKPLSRMQGQQRTKDGPVNRDDWISEASFVIGQILGLISRGTVIGLDEIEDQINAVAAKIYRIEDPRSARPTPRFQDAIADIEAAVNRLKLVAKE